MENPTGSRRTRWGFVQPGHFRTPRDLIVPGSDGRDSIASHQSPQLLSRQLIDGFLQKAECFHGDFTV